MRLAAIFIDFKNVSIGIFFLIIRIVGYERCLRVHVPYVDAFALRTSQLEFTFMLLLR